MPREASEQRPAATRLERGIAHKAHYGKCSGPVKLDRGRISIESGRGGQVVAWLTRVAKAHLTLPARHFYTDCQSARERGQGGAEDGHETSCSVLVALVGDDVCDILSHGSDTFRDHEGS